MSSEKLFIQKREQVLLLYSEITKQYPWLKRLLSENKRISFSLVDELDPKEQNFMNNILPGIIKEAVNEWKGDEKKPAEVLDPNKENWLQCSLSGTWTRYVFYITNIRNGNSLNVGKECVKHFGMEIDHLGRTPEELIRNANKIYLKGKIDEEIPGLIKQIEIYWDQELSQYPIFIPNRLEKPFVELQKKAKKLLDRFLEEKETLDEAKMQFNRIIADKKIMMDPIVKTRFLGF